MLRKVLKEAKVEKHITLHGLRHSGITFYSQDRSQIAAISKNASHSRTSITESIYMHVLHEHQIAAADSANKLNELLIG